MNMKQNLPLNVYEALDETRLLLEGFQPAVLIFTYHSLPKQLRVVEVETYDLRCYDAATLNAVRVRKIDVMFAIKADTLGSVKGSIYVDTAVKGRNLQTALKRHERPIVVTNAKLKPALSRCVRLLMRSGHVLLGRLVRYSGYNMVLNINGVMVLVYRHGVLEFSIRPEQT